MESYSSVEHRNNLCSYDLKDSFIGNKLIEAISTTSHNVRNSDFKKCVEELRQFTSNPKSIRSNYKEIIKIILSNLESSSIENIKSIIDLLLAFIGDLKQTIIPILPHLIEFLKALIHDSSVIKCDYKNQLLHIFTYLNDWVSNNFELFHQLFEPWLTSSSLILQSHSSFVVGTMIKRFDDELYQHSIIHFIQHANNLSNCDLYYNYINSIGLVIAHSLYNSQTNLFWKADQLIRCSLSIFESITQNINNSELLNNELFINSLFSIFLNSFYNLKCMDAPINSLIKILISGLEKYIVNITRELNIEDNALVFKNFNFESQELSIAFGTFIQSSLYHPSVMASFYFNSLFGLIYWGKPITDVDIIKPIELSVESLIDLKSLNQQHLIVIYNNVLLPNFEFLCDLISNLILNNTGKYNYIIQLSDRVLKKLIFNITQTYKLLDNTFDNQLILIQYTNRTLYGLSKIVTTGKDYPECIDLIHQILKSIKNLRDEYMNKYLELTSCCLNVLNNFNKMILAEGGIHPIYDFLVLDILEYLNEFTLLYSTSDPCNNGVIMESTSLLLDCTLTFIQYNLLSHQLKSFNNNLKKLFKKSLTLLVDHDNCNEFSANAISNAIKNIEIIFIIISKVDIYDTLGIELCIKEFSNKLSVNNHSLEKLVSHCTTNNLKSVIFAIYIILSYNYKLHSEIYEYLSHNKSVIKQIIKMDSFKDIVLQLYRALITRLIIPNQSIQLLILDCFDGEILLDLNNLSDAKPITRGDGILGVLDKLRGLISINYSIIDQRSKINMTRGIIENASEWPCLLYIITINVLSSQLLYKFEPIWSCSVESISSLIKLYKGDVPTIYEFDFLEQFYRLYSSFIKSSIQKAINDEFIYLDDSFQFTNKGNAISIPLYHNIRNDYNGISSGFNERALNIFDMIKSYGNPIDTNQKEITQCRKHKLTLDRSKRKPFLYLIESKLYSSISPSQAQIEAVEGYTDSIIVIKNFSSILLSIIMKLGSLNNISYYEYICEIIMIAKQLVELDCCNSILNELLIMINSIIQSKIKAFDFNLNNQTNKSILDLSVLIINRFSVLPTNIKDKCTLLISSSINQKESFNTNILISLINGNNIKSTIESILNSKLYWQTIVYNKLLYKTLFCLTSRFDTGFKSDRHAIIDFINSSPTFILPCIYYELFSSIICIKNKTCIYKDWDDVIKFYRDEHDRFYQTTNIDNWNGGLIIWNPVSINIVPGAYETENIILIDKLGSWVGFSAEYSINIDFINSSSFIKWVKWFYKSMPLLSIILKPINTFLFQLLYELFIIYSSFNPYSTQSLEPGYNTKNPSMTENNSENLIASTASIYELLEMNDKDTLGSESEIDPQSINDDVDFDLDIELSNPNSINSNKKRHKSDTELVLAENVVPTLNNCNDGGNTGEMNNQSKKEINIIKSMLLNLIAKLVTEFPKLHLKVPTLFEIIGDTFTKIIRNELGVYIRHSNKISYQLINLVSAICRQSIESKKFIYTILDEVSKSFGYFNNLECKFNHVAKEAVQMTICLFTDLYLNSDDFDPQYLIALVVNLRCYWSKHSQLSDSEMSFLSMSIELAPKYSDFLFLILITSNNVSKFNQKGCDFKVINKALRAILSAYSKFSAINDHDEGLFSEIICESDKLTLKYLSKCRDLRGRKYACEIMAITSVCEIRHKKLSITFEKIFERGYTRDEMESLFDRCGDEAAYWRFAMAKVLETLYCIKSGTLIIKVNIDENINFLSDFTEKYICKTKAVDCKMIVINKQPVSAFIKPLIANFYFLMTCKCEWLEMDFVFLKAIALFYTSILEKACAMLVFGSQLEALEGEKLFRLLFHLTVCVEILIKKGHNHTVSTAIEILKRVCICIKKYKYMILSRFSNESPEVCRFNTLTSMLFGDISETLPEIINTQSDDNLIIYGEYRVAYGERGSSHFVFEFDDVKRPKRVSALRKMCQFIGNFSHISLARFAIPISIHFLTQPGASRAKFSNSMADAASEFISAVISKHLQFDVLFPTLMDASTSAGRNRIFRTISRGLLGFQFTPSDGNCRFLSSLMELIKPHITAGASDSKASTRPGKRRLLAGSAGKSDRGVQESVHGACEVYAVICRILESTYCRPVDEEVMWAVRRLSNMLKSRDRDFRRTARAGLARLCSHISVNNLKAVIGELDHQLEGGYKIPVLSLTSLKVLQSFSTALTPGAEFPQGSMEPAFAVVRKELRYILDSEALERGIGGSKEINWPDEGRRQYFADICQLLAKHAQTTGSADSDNVGKLYSFCFGLIPEFKMFNKFPTKFKEVLTAIGRGLISSVNPMLRLADSLLWLSIRNMRASRNVSDPEREGAVELGIPGFGEYLSKGPEYYGGLGDFYQTHCNSKTRIASGDSTTLGIPETLAVEFYRRIISTCLDITAGWVSRFTSSNAPLNSSDSLIKSPESDAVDIRAIVYSFVCGDSQLEERASICLAEWIKLNSAALEPYSWAIVRHCFWYFSRIQCHRDVKQSHKRLLKIFTKFLSIHSDACESNLKEAMGDADKLPVEKIYASLLQVSLSQLWDSSMKLPMLQLMHHLFMKRTVIKAGRELLVKCIDNVVKVMLRTQTHNREIFTHGTGVLLLALNHTPPNDVLATLERIFCKLIRNANCNGPAAFAVFRRLAKSPHFPPTSHRGSEGVYRCTSLIFFLCYSALASAGRGALESSSRDVCETLSLIFRLQPSRASELLRTVFQILQDQINANAPTVSKFDNKTEAVKGNLFGHLSAFCKTCLILSMCVQEQGLEQLLNGSLVQLSYWILNFSLTYASELNMQAVDASDMRFFDQLANMALKALLNVLNLLTRDHSHLIEQIVVNSDRGRTKTDLTAQMITAQKDLMEECSQTLRDKGGDRGKKSAIRCLNGLWRFVCNRGLRYGHPWVEASSIACFNALVRLAGPLLASREILRALGTCLDKLGFSRLIESQSRLLSAVVELVTLALGHLEATTLEIPSLASDITANSGVEIAKGIEAECGMFNGAGVDLKRPSFFERLALAGECAALKSSISWLAFLVRRHLGNLKTRFRRLEAVLRVLQHLVSNSAYIYSERGLPELTRIVMSARIACSHSQDPTPGFSVRKDSSETYARSRGIVQASEYLLSCVEKEMGRLGRAHEYLRLVSRISTMIVRRRRCARSARARQLLSDPQLAARRRIAKHRHKR